MHTKIKAVSLAGAVAALIVAVLNVMGKGDLSDTYASVITAAAAIIAGYLQPSR